MLTVVLAVLLILGGVAFHFLETTNEEDARTVSRDYYKKILGMVLNTFLCFFIYPYCKILLEMYLV